MNIRFISDLHFDHKNIIKYSKERSHLNSVEEHNQWIIDQWNSVVHKRDLVWILGDVSFSKEGLKLLKKLKGQKHLILGNHDTFALELYQQYFNKIHGFMRYKGFWLSHCPIKEQQLRGRKNIHGHIHGNSTNENYFNVSVEALEGKPITLDEIKDYFNSLQID